MGMFDNIQCEYELPDIKNREVGPDPDFQTKSTPAQSIDRYKITKEGYLYHHNYDLEDHSDPNAKGLGSLTGMLTPTNHRWEFEDKFTGEIVFYSRQVNDKWIEFSSYFIKGVLQSITRIE